MRLRRVPRHPPVGHPSSVACRRSSSRRLVTLRHLRAPVLTSGVSGLTIPGPRGSSSNHTMGRLYKKAARRPPGWQFDESDWWLEEHGLIMPGPAPLPAKSFTKETGAILPARQYVVTGDRELTTVLTVHEDGRWELAKGSLYDVTHLPCRSARYTPAQDGSACTPAQADRAQFPVRPGAVMPPVPSCAKQDYAVLFVVAVQA